MERNLIHFNNKVNKSISLLDQYIVNEDYEGYDPYDTLNSSIPFHYFGKWTQILAIQFQKRNPINIRKFIGIKKFRSTKGMGLLLSAYLNLYLYQNDKKHIPKIEKIKNWLLNNQSYYNNHICWGYDFPYATISEKVDKKFPTVIHHSYIMKSLFQYYLIFKDELVKKTLIKCEEFLLKDLNINKYKEGISFSYHPEVYNGCCYNASMHAANCLAIVYHFKKDEKLLSLIYDSLNFIVSMQQKDGSWNYSFANYGGAERKQIDFHQGFILESFYEIKKILNKTEDSWEKAINKGLDFYFKNQFDPYGKSFWRLPKKYPIDIHNQAQGIITFKKYRGYNKSYDDFYKKIAIWTIDNMQSNRKGNFYYRKYKLFTNKIPYIRWSQSWMLLALSESIIVDNKQ